MEEIFRHARITALDRTSSYTALPRCSCGALKEGISGDRSYEWSFRAGSHSSRPRGVRALRTFSALQIRPDGCCPMSSHISGAPRDVFLIVVGEHLQFRDTAA